MLAAVTDGNYINARQVTYLWHGSYPTSQECHVNVGVCEFVLLECVVDSVFCPTCASLLQEFWNW